MTLPTNSTVQQREWFGRRAYVVLSFFTYQIAFGVSLRVYDGAPHLRLYVGPFKVALGGRKV